VSKSPRIYDLVMTHNLDTDDFFIHRIQQHCAERGLNFFLVEPMWAALFLEKIRRQEVWPRVLLNMHSEHHLPEDVYHQLVLLAHEKHTKVIDPPDLAGQAFDKGLFHFKLVEAGVKTPVSIIVPKERIEGFVLSDTEKAALGIPFVIKPSMGYGRRGVILDAVSEADLARSVAAWPGQS
jgi:carbamoylphosphate synthase large subunit